MKFSGRFPHQHWVRSMEKSSTIEVRFLNLDRRMVDYIFGEGVHDILFYGQDTERWENEGGR